MGDCTQPGVYVRLYPALVLAWLSGRALGSGAFPVYPRSKAYGCSHPHRRACESDGRCMRLGVSGKLQHCRGRDR